MPHNSDELLTEREVCGRADFQIPVSHNTLRKSRWTGKLLGCPAPVYIKVGRYVWYQRSDIIDWRQQYLRSYKSTAEYRLQEEGQSV